MTVDPSFRLRVTRRFGKNDDHDFFVVGDGPFMVQEIDVLLADPGIVAFTMRREPKVQNPDSQFQL